MKYSMILKTSALLAFSMGVAMGQTKATPVVRSQSSSRHSTFSSNLHSVNLVLRKQMRQIPKDLKAGKITKTQAQTAWENLKNLRKQELEFFRQNGQRELTADQKNQINGLLNQNAGSI